VSDLITMDQYITTHLKVNRKFKNQSERKKFLKEKGVKFVKHPKSGVEMVAVECKTQLLQGKRVSASRVKEYDYDAESKAAAKEAHEKAAAEIDLSDKVNTKEDIDKMVNDEEGESNSDSSSTSSEDSGSSWGNQSEGSGKGKRRAQAKRTSAPKPRKPDAKTKSKPKPAAASKEADMKSTLESGNKVLPLLEELTAPTLWRSSVRASEVDRRMGRSGPLLREIADLMTDPAADKESEDYKSLHTLSKKMQEEIDRISALRDLCKFIRGSTSDQMAEDVATNGSMLENFGYCWKSLLECEGTLVDMVGLISKKILEAPDYLLIKFLQLSDSKMCAVNLQALFTTPPHEHRSDGFHTCLRKAQHTGVEHMFDRLKQNNSVAWAKSSFDPKLKDIDFDDDKRWLPMPSETKINDFANVSGYTCGNMRDFQKIFACLDMEDGGHQDSSFLRKVANAGKGKGVFSTKLTLAMQLWSKVLSAHREVAATALTLKQASSLADTAKTLAKTEPSSILSASWDDLMNHEKLVKQLAARGAVVRQLEAATDVQGSADAKAALQDACTQLAEWASSQLCPEFESILASLQSWAAETIQLDMTTSSFDDSVQAFPKEMFTIPDSVDNSFLLACFLASQHYEWK
ncbi:unnamed protein product, partial [Durusdinium trenchii]